MKKKTILLTALALGLTTVAGLTPSAEPVKAASVTKKYLVVFKNESNLPSNVDSLLKNAGGTVTKKLDNLGAVQVESNNPQFNTVLKSSPYVSTVSVEGTIFPDVLQGVPMETLDTEETATGTHDLYDKYGWDIKQVTNNGESWNLKGGTGKSSDGKDIVVGVIDTGIDYNHPDLKDNYVYGKSFVPGYSDPIDDKGHGTHVAGAIAANGRVVGVGPQLKIASYRVFGPTGGAATSDIAAALQAAGDDNVDVVNMSLGGYNWLHDPESTPGEIIADQLLFERAISYATKKGVTVVGSSGNNGVNLSNPIQLTKDLYGPDAKGPTFRSPSSPLMLRVAANGIGLNRAYYSNYGAAHIHVSAPGGDYGPLWQPGGDPSLMDGNARCLSTYPGGGYAWSIGTSMASPKAAALAGVIIAKHGKDKLSPAQVKNKIMGNTTDILNKGFDQYSGFGLINATKALNSKF
ncbi:S8 family serine peptidase [Tumebacillus lipolyticus]|uniref:S8 family serine peptidase n=1 Tax=Tumebacillus lipolyticus TaxID=1280370 RepID=A0ABW4ZSS7_9BACL